MSEQEKITITKEEFEYLIKRDDWLSCLEIAGVDNWDGISCAYEMLESEEEE